MIDAEIQWTDLPLAIRKHLLDRLEERKITAEDLYKLKLWRESEPDAPEGDLRRRQIPQDISAEKPGGARKGALRVFKADRA